MKKSNYQNKSEPEEVMELLFFIAPLGIIVFLSLLGVLFWFITTGSSSGYLREGYFLLILIFLFVALIKVFIEFYRKLKKHPFGEAWGVSFLFVLVFTYSLITGLKYSLEFDEGLTGLLREMFHHGPVQAGITVHQPPLFYSIDYFMSFLFPDRDWVIRTVSNLSAAVVACQAFLIAKKHGAPRWAAATMSCALFLSGVFLRYSFEYRPYMLSMVPFFSFLYFLEASFEARVNPDDQKNLVLFAGVANLICLLTLGMQPLAIDCICIGYFVISLAWSRKYLNQLIMLLASVVLYFPFCYWVYVDAPRIFRALDKSSEVTKLLSDFFLLIPGWIPRMFIPFVPWTQLVFVLMVVIFIKKRPLSKILQGAQSFSLLLFVLISVFLLTTNPFLRVFINYFPSDPTAAFEAFPRYHIYLYPLCFYFLVWAVGYLFKGHNTQRMAIYWCLLIGLLWLAPEHQITMPPPNYKAIYQFLNEKMTPADHLIVLLPAQCGQPTATILDINADYYLKPSLLAERKKMGSIETLVRIPDFSKGNLFIVWPGFGLPFFQEPPRPEKLQKNGIAGLRLVLDLPESAIYEADLAHLDQKKFFVGLSQLSKLDPNSSMSVLFEALSKGSPLTEDALREISTCELYKVLKWKKLISGNSALKNIQKTL